MSKTLDTSSGLSSGLSSLTSVSSGLTSGLSSLTSRIGGAVGGASAVGPSASSGRGPGGRGGPPGPRMGPGPRRPMMNGSASGGPGPGMRGSPQQQQQQQQQRQNQYNPQMSSTPRQQQPGPRPKKQEMYAPSMNQLYSLNGESDGMTAANEDDSSDDGEHAMNDTTDDEGTMDNDYPGRMPPQRQSMPRQPASQEYLGAKPQLIPPFFNSGVPRQQRPASSSRQPRPGNNNVGRPLPSSNQQRRYYDDEDDYNSSSIGNKVKSALGGCIPQVRIPKLFKKSLRSSAYDDGSWSDDEALEPKSSRISTIPSSRSISPVGRSAAALGIVPGPVRSLLSKCETLLSPVAAKTCTSIGRSQALLDVAQIALWVCILKEVLPLFYNALSSTAVLGSVGRFGGGMINLRQAVLSTLLTALTGGDGSDSSSSGGWTPYALSVIFLLSASNKVWIQPALQATYLEAASENAADAAYTQLYLRLVSSLPMISSKSLSSEVCKAVARAQAFSIAATARLRSFVMMAVVYILLSTVAVLRPAGVAVGSALYDMVRLLHKTLYTPWQNKGSSKVPIEWDGIGHGLKDVGMSLGKSLRVLFESELDVVRRQPLRVAVVVSLLVALVSITYLPSLEMKNGCSGNNGITSGDDEEDDLGATGITSLWSNIGASSATRLGLLSSPRGVEGALEQFTKLRPGAAASAGIALRPGGKKRRMKESKRQGLRLSFQPLLKKVMYSTSSLVLLSVPLAIYLYLLASASTKQVSDTDGDGLSFISVLTSMNTIPESGWLSLSELAMLLTFTHLRAVSAVNNAIQVNKLQLEHSINSFFRKLLETVRELEALDATKKNGADFQAMLTASPTKGISVTDFWAAHHNSSRRAWAVKGSNIQCKNGEVVLVIGADGSGKTRMLTAIAEHIFVPPNSARTTTHVRGTIAVGGVELSKWDRSQLQKRVGLYLNDVRTVSDYASLLAGCTLEEILEPVPLEGGRVGPKERNAMAVAMKITGLGSKVLSRLPSKLSTVVIANEDELKPSSLRPPSYPLSPSDWSRVLLTKILAQLISGNDIQLSASLSSSPDIVKKCMIGSILLIDDATSQMSEVDEAHFITTLRSTGAAALLTSNRWATGRFADRIVVVDGGAVVESGTHGDLINLGPERSLYARQWTAMSSV